MLTKNDYKLHGELMREWWLKAEEKANILKAENELLKLKIKSLKKQSK